MSEKVEIKIQPESMPGAIMLAARVAELEKEVERLTKQSDKWMIDFGIASAKNAELQAEIEQLNHRIEAKNNALAITVATLKLIEAAL